MTNSINTSSVYLIRHAQSIANAGGKTLTPDGIRLSKDGKTQAQKLVEILGLQKPDQIRYSKYIRTFQTAKPTLEYFSDVQHGVLPTIHEITYLDPDLCKNTNYDERAEMRNEYRKNGAHYRHGKNAETFNEFIMRIDQTLEYIKNIGPSRLEYIFSHEMFIQGLLGRLQTGTHQVNDDYKLLSKNVRSQIKVNNAQIIKLEIQEGEIFLKDTMNS